MHAMICPQCSVMTSRSIPLFLCFCFALALTSCVTIPHGLESRISWRGAHATRTTSIGPFLFVSTASILPGDTRLSQDMVELDNCSDPSLRIHIEVYGSPAGGVDHRYCSALLSAVSWLTGHAAIDDLEVHYNIIAAPIGQRFLRRRSGLYTKRTVRLFYALPWSKDDVQASIIIGATSLAHETFHLISATKGISRNLRTEEILAYKAGVCAQFNATNVLRRRDLQRADLTSTGLPGNAGISSSAGSEVDASIVGKYLNEDDAIGTSSRAGAMLLRDCNREIGNALRIPD